MLRSLRSTSSASRAPLTGPVHSRTNCTFARNDFFSTPPLVSLLRRAIRQIVPALDPISVLSPPYNFHFLPAIRKLLAALKTDRVSFRRWAEPLAGLPKRNWKTCSFIRTPERHVFASTPSYGRKNSNSRLTAPPSPSRPVPRSIRVQARERTARRLQAGVHPREARLTPSTS